MGEREREMHTPGALWRQEGKVHVGACKRIGDANLHVLVQVHAPWFAGLATIW